MDNIMNFGQDLPEPMELNEVSTDIFYDDNSGADTFTMEETNMDDKPTLNEDDCLGCGSSYCIYCGGKGYYWSCGENVTCVRCGGSGIGD